MIEMLRRALNDLDRLRSMQDQLVGSNNALVLRNRALEGLARAHMSAYDFQTAMADLKTPIFPAFQAPLKTVAQLREAAEALRDLIEARQRMLRGAELDEDGEYEDPTSRAVYSLMTREVGQLEGLLFAMGGEELNSQGQRLSSSLPEAPDPPPMETPFEKDLRDLLDDGWDGIRKEDLEFVDERPLPRMDDRVGDLEKELAAVQAQLQRRDQLVAKLKEELKEVLERCDALDSGALPRRQRINELEKELEEEKRKLKAMTMAAYGVQNDRDELRKLLSQAEMKASRMEDLYQGTKRELESAQANNRLLVNRITQLEKRLHSEVSPPYPRMDETEIPEGANPVPDPDANERVVRELLGDAPLSPLAQAMLSHEMTPLVDALIKRLLEKLLKSRAFAQLLEKEAGIQKEMKELGSLDQDPPYNES